MRSTRFVWAVAAVFCLATTAAPKAQAQVARQGPPITVTVSSGGRTVAITPEFEAGVGAGGETVLRLKRPVDVEDGGVFLGRIGALQIGGSGPSAPLQFVVTAGPSTTVFTITSALVNYGPFTEILAYASAGVTVTDVDGDGATLTGTQSGGNAYEARLNGAGWQRLVPTTAAAADDTAVTDDRAPASGETGLVGSYASLQSEFAFTLTANDSASGTSNFTIVPALVPNAPALSVEVSPEGEVDGGPPAKVEPRLVRVGDREWAIQEPFEVVDGGRLVARIDSLRALMLPGDPSISLNFAVTAGTAATVFTLTSATLSFPPIDNPLAHVSAGITVTDIDGDGATLTGLQTGARALEARYNTSTPWAQIVASASSPTDDTASARDRRPAAGWEVISATVSDTQLQWSFELSANDSASGTSRFAVLAAPEPIPVLGRAGLAAALFLICLLGLLALRRP